MNDLDLGEITWLNEGVEANAWANYFQCAPAEFKQRFRAESYRVGSVWVSMIPKLDWAFFNRINGIGSGEPVSEADLDQAVGLLQQAGCKNYMVQAAPTAQPGQLPEWLSARGFKKSRNWAKMYRDNQPVQEVSGTDLRIQAVGKAYAEDFADVALQAFGMPEELRPLICGIFGQPGWRHYMAFDGSQPVSAAALYISGDTGWLGLGSTLESHRKRGGQGALFTRRLQDGLALGCRWFVTEAVEDTPEAPNPSYHNMLRSGFRLAYLRPNYVVQG